MSMGSVPVTLAVAGSLVRSLGHSNFRSCDHRCYRACDKVLWEPIGGHLANLSLIATFNVPSNHFMGVFT
jgi:hypothetical protein